MPKNLNELRAGARATAKRIDDRLAAAIGENRDLTAEEEAAHTADQGELAGLNEQIATAEAAGEDGGDDAAGSDATPDATAAERARVVALLDLCPNSAIGSGLRSAIADGKEAGAFAIDLATAAKSRGASMSQLKNGAVQPDQLPTGGAPGAVPGKDVATGAEKGKATVSRLAKLGHSAFKHLAPAK